MTNKVDTSALSLDDDSRIGHSLRILINNSIFEENQEAIFQTITLSKLLSLLKKHEHNDAIVPLIVWLLSHLALNDDNGRAMLDCEEFVSLLNILLEQQHDLLIGKTLWLLNNLSLLADKSHILVSAIGPLVHCMETSGRLKTPEKFVICSDIILNLIHKDSCTEYVNCQSQFISEKGLEIILEILKDLSRFTILNSVSSILEIISAYSAEWRTKIVQVGLLVPLVAVSKIILADARIAREQAMKTIFNISFLAGNKEVDLSLLESECLGMVVDVLAQDPPDEGMQKIAVSILANLLVSETIRNELPSEKLALGFAGIVTRVREEHTYLLSSLIPAIANAAIDDGCREEIRRQGVVETELQRLGNRCHPSLRPLVSVAKDNLKLDGTKSAPTFLDVNENSTGFIGRLLGQRSSLAPSHKREMKPLREPPKKSIADMLSAAIPKRSMSKIINVDDEEWKD